MTVRSLLFWPHLVAGVLAGLVILLMSVTGVLLTYERQMIAWSDREFRSVPAHAGQARLPIETLVARFSESHPDVTPAAEGAKGYNALVFLAPAGQGEVHKAILEFLYDKGKGTGARETVGEVLYNRGLTAAVMTVEAVKRAQSKYGNKPLSGEQVRWGLEHLAIDERAIKELGFAGFLNPIHTSCLDHEGGSSTQIHTWDGSRWVVQPGVYTPDQQILRPMILASAEKYAEAKKLPMRDCAKESQ